MEAPIGGRSCRGHGGLDFESAGFGDEAVVDEVSLILIGRTQGISRTVLGSAFEGVDLRSMSHRQVDKTARAALVPDPDVKPGIVGGPDAQA